jgi:hypothetical protein
MNRTTLIVPLLLALNAGAAAGDHSYPARPAASTLSPATVLAMDDDDRSMTSPDQQAKRKKAAKRGKKKHGAPGS